MAHNNIIRQIVEDVITILNVDVKEEGITQIAVMLSHKYDLEREARVRIGKEEI